MTRIGFYVRCEGMGDCLYAVPVIRKFCQEKCPEHEVDVFSHHPELFKRIPWISGSHAIGDGAGLKVYGLANQVVPLFDLSALPHWAMDTCDFISVPLGIGTLSFREKQLEYVPLEVDQTDVFDVVINTSETWPSRSWPRSHWQRLADGLVARGFSVAVVGKDVASRADQMQKRAMALAGCVDLTNKLSLDQTFHTLRKARVFVSGQNGLSVLAGATDTEVVVLDMSIEWSKRAIYRHDSPFHKVEYVKGRCQRYCCEWKVCPLPEPAERFLCQPDYAAVEDAVLRKLGIAA